MAKFTILGDFDAGALPLAVPPDYRRVVRAVTNPGIEYTTVLFSHDRRDVVTSAAVRRALARIAAGKPILAVGANFTAEAIELLNERGAVIARLGEFEWTDATFHAL